MMKMVYNIFFVISLVLACVGYVSAVGASAGAYTSKNAVKFGYMPPSRGLVLEEANRKGLLDALAADIEAREESGCFGKRCSANEHCCRGSVCIDLDGQGGSCFPVVGAKEGEMCLRDHDCSAGLLCMETPEGEGILRTCQSRYTFVAGRKTYNEDCLTSSECDVTKGLCCQIQRRHRMSTRRKCLYFKDAGSCLGAVDTLSAP